MLVERSVYDRALEIAKETAAKVQVGNPEEEGRHMGPVVSEQQFNKIQGLIEKGIAEGAKLIAGGPGKPEGFETGYFVKPTIFADVSNDMVIAREEVFGPVLAILPFETEEEAHPDRQRYALWARCLHPDPGCRKSQACRQTVAGRHGAHQWH